MFIKHFHLQAVSKYAREVWEFVNLYSKTRGANRFPTLVRSLRLLADRPQVRARNVQIFDPTPIEEWIARESKLGNATLAAEVKQGNHALIPVKEWSDAVNRAIEEIVQGVPPFPLFCESLNRMAERADCMVISQTPTEALEREWLEHDIRKGVILIAGQEMGTKKEHLNLATNGKYAPGKILMVGDAPGDYTAAQANGALFYPIIPGDEEASWKQFHDHALDLFFTGHYAGAYQEQLIERFESSLPEDPPWA